MMRGPWLLSPVIPLLLAAGGAVALLVALPMAPLIDTMQGAYPASVSGLWPGAAASVGADVAWHALAPRLVMALCTGAALGVSGALMQGLLGHPLADPGLTGVSGGAALGAGIAAALVSMLPMAWREGLGLWPMPVCAVLGGRLVMALVVPLSRAHRQGHGPGLLAGGLAINALAMAGLGLLSSLGGEAPAHTLSFWLLGRLGGSQWPGALAGALVVVAVLWAVSGPVPGAAPSQPRALDALALGETQARLMGVPVSRLQRRWAWGVALAVGTVTAFTGVVGFIGVLAPQAVRLLKGPDHRVVLPASAAMGAVLVVLADAVVRRVPMPAELPLGGLTGLVGVPVVLWMLRRRFITSSPRPRSTP